MVFDKRKFPFDGIEVFALLFGKAAFTFNAFARFILEVGVAFAFGALIVPSIWAIAGWTRRNENQ